MKPERGSDSSGAKTTIFSAAILLILPSPNPNTQNRQRAKKSFAGKLDNYYLSQ